MAGTHHGVGRQQAEFVLDRRGGWWGSPRRTVPSPRAAMEQRVAGEDRAEGGSVEAGGTGEWPGVAIARSSTPPAVSTWPSASSRNALSPCVVSHSIVSAGLAAPGASRSAPSCGATVMVVVAVRAHHGDDVDGPPPRPRWLRVVCGVDDDDPNRRRRARCCCRLPNCHRRVRRCRWVTTR